MKPIEASWGNEKENYKESSPCKTRLVGRKCGNGPQSADENAEQLISDLNYLFVPMKLRGKW